jgi:hypothetical protein
MPRDQVGAGKGDDPRPRQVTREEADLRWRLAYEVLDMESKAEILTRINVLVETRKYGNRQQT